MEPKKKLGIAAASGIAAVLVASSVLEKRVARLEQRSTELEKRIAMLESQPDGVAVSTKSKNKRLFRLPVRVTRKRFRPARFDLSTTEVQVEDYLDIAMSIDCAGLKKPARAISGRFRFSDLFGKLNYDLRYTISKPAKPGEQLAVEFSFVCEIPYLFQMDPRWVNETAIEDMLVDFEVHEAIYADGSRRKFPASRKR